MSRPGKEHWKGIKRILRYVQGTVDYGLIFRAKDNTCSLTEYSDANWAGDLETIHSTSGYVFQIEGSTLSWCSKKQTCISKSTTNAKYAARSLSASRSSLIEKFNENNIGSTQKTPSIIYVDNRGAFDGLRIGEECKVA